VSGTEHIGVNKKRKSNRWIRGSKEQAKLKAKNLSIGRPECIVSIIKRKSLFVIDLINSCNAIYRYQNGIKL
jgi:hypothetical protein